MRSLVRGIAYPLNLGEMGETHFGSSRYVETALPATARRWWSADGGEAETLDRRSRRSGLSEEVQNLLVLTFAWQTGRSFFLHGGPCEATIESIPDEVELRQQHCLHRASGSRPSGERRRSSVTPARRF